MNMTPDQLRFLREQRGLTREQLAAYLGDCTASTVNKWERGINPVPSWVAEKMFSKMPITFTVQELAEMYDLCREEGFTMTELMQEAVRDLIEKHRTAQTNQAKKTTHQSDKIINLKAAEDTPRYRTGDDKTGTED